MLQSVCLKNFVKFGDQHVIKFTEDEPSIFIGENGSGKSSVFEGIRRCLKLELSTSKSSVPDPKTISYFICNTDSGASANKENYLFGIVTIPLPDEQNAQSTIERTMSNSEDTTEIEHAPKDLEGSQSPSKKMGMRLDDDSPSSSSKQLMSSGTDSINSSDTSFSQPLESDYSSVDVRKSDCQTYKKSSRYYKFAMKCSEDAPMFIDLIETSPDGNTNLCTSSSYILTYTSSPNQLGKLISCIVGEKIKDNDVGDSIQAIFTHSDTFKNANEPTNNLNEILSELTKKFAFTFPLRSIGPLQWSESERINFEERENNYKEAENRCEIIRYFLENKNMFDTNKEEKYFQQLTQSKDYNFELSDDGKIDVPNEKFALLKTPEGILEAKAFSIILSSKQYNTFILEEPDRGMHPQMVERMIQIIKQDINDKRVILTTHQKGFITPWTIPNTFVFRRCSETKNKIIQCNSIFGEENDANMTKMRMITSHQIPDIFFAKTVLFYEGDSEQLFLEELKTQILSGDPEITSHLKKEILKSDEAVTKLKDCLMEYTLIKMLGVGKIAFFEDVCSNLNLGYKILVDRDAVSEILTRGTPKTNRKQEQVLAQGRSLNDWKILRKRKMIPKSIFFWLNGTIEDMVKAMCETEKDLEKELRELNVIIRKGNQIIFEENKLFLHEGIKMHNIEKSVKLLVVHCKPKHDFANFIKFLAKYDEEEEEKEDEEEEEEEKEEEDDEEKEEEEKEEKEDKEEEDDEEEEECEEEKEEDEEEVD